MKEEQVLMAQKQPLVKQIFHSLRRFMAKNWLRSMPAVQIGITGSHGKTNTTQAITKVLSSKFKVIQTDTNLDTIYNVPITALKVRPWHKAVVFELGIDQKNEMDLHLQIAKPQIAVVTGIAPVHSDEEHLGSLTNIITEKRKLIEALPKDGLAILNWDDENVRKMAKHTKAEIVFYGTDKKNCQIWAKDIQVTLNGLRFNMFINRNFPSFRTRFGISGQRILKPSSSAGRQVQDDAPVRHKVKTGLIGQHHIYTCMAVVAVALKMGANTKKAIKNLEELKPLKGRLSIERGPLGTILLNDSLRANPASTKAGLLFLKELGAGRRKVVVLGEMGELGEWKIKKHKEIGKIAAKSNLDYLICVGPLQKHTANQAIKHGASKKKVFWVKDVFEAAERSRNILRKGDLLYLKASLLRHMERIILLLQNKKVECRAVSCNFYNQCGECNYLESGLNKEG